MKINMFTVAAATLMATMSCFAGSRTGGPYSVTDTMDASGGRGVSADSTYKNDASLGGIGGLSAATAPSESMKHGYIGQLYDTVGFVVAATVMTVAEGQTRQINGFDLLDDLSLLAADPTAVSWGVLSGPITSVSNSGLATAGRVYQNTSATVQGSRNSFSSSLTLSVLNVNSDDYGAYATDGIDDDWQVLYFGENNLNGGPLSDPDGDGQNNGFEFLAGLVPNDPASRFTLTLATVPAQPAQKRLIYSPIVAGRIYTPQFRESLTSGAWDTLTGAVQNDNGIERTLTDPNAAGTSKVYRIQISKP